MGFCGSLDPEDDDDGSAPTGFAPGPEPSGAAAISEYKGVKWALGVMRIFAVGGGRVVGSRGRGPLFQEAVAVRGNLTKSRANLL